MIHRAQIAKAARDADEATADGIEKWGAERNISIPDLDYVAGQRGLRAAMLLDGKDPRQMTGDQLQIVRLSAHARGLIPLLAANWMDGFACGFTVEP